MPQPFPDVQPHRFTLLQAGRHSQNQLASLSAPLHRLENPPDPLGHGPASGLDLVGAEVVGHVVELQLEAIHRVALERFFDQGEPLPAHRLVLEVQAVESGEGRIDPAPGADFQVAVVETELRGPGVLPALSGPLLNQQHWVNQHPPAAGPVADDTERILAGLDQALGILVGAAEDEVGPLLVPEVVSPELSHPGVVQHRAAVAHGEHQRFHRGPQQLVHGGIVLLLLHGGLVHVDQGMTAVVVEHDAGLARPPAGSRRGGLRLSRLQGSRVQPTGQAGCSSCLEEAAPFHGLLHHPGVSGLEGIGSLSRSGTGLRPGQGPVPGESSCPSGT